MTADPSSFAPDIDQQAAAWLARRDCGLTAAEQDEFFQWLADDPRHGETLARHQQTVARLKLLAQWQPEHGRRPNPDLLAPGPDWRRGYQPGAASASPPARRGTASPASLLSSSVLSFWLPLAAAAGLALVLLWERSSSRQTEPDVTPAFASTPPIVRKVLEDGSTIDLNHGAEVEVSYSVARRDVKLLRGEASFAVAKNPDRPFVVNAGGVEVRAVGTAFNVNLRTKTVAVLVTEGRVAVSGEQRRKSRQQGDSPFPDSAADPQGSGFRSQLILAAGERTVVDLAMSAEPRIESVPDAEMTRVLAWQPRQLEFNDTPLAQVVAEFNASNRVKMVVDDPQLASVPVGASLRSDNVVGFIRVLESSFHVKAERRADGVIVLRPE